MHNIPGWDPRNGRAERPSLKFVNEEELEGRSKNLASRERGHPSRFSFFPPRFSVARTTSNDLSIEICIRFREMEGSIDIIYLRAISKVFGEE